MRGLTATLVYNPNSGRRRAPQLAERFVELWRETTGTTPHLRPTTCREDIRIAAKETASQSDVQVFLGGDGTFSEGLQGLFEQNGFQALQKPVGLLPAGTGNSFLRDFGISDFESAFHSLLKALQEKSPAVADAGLLSYHGEGRKISRIVMNIWGIGFIPSVTELAVKWRRLGALNYTMATCAKLFTHKPYKYRASVDGQAEEVVCDFITISNSRFTGGSMLIAPPVRVDDNKLFLVCPSLKSRLRVLRLFPRIFSGTHLNVPRVRSHFVHNFALKTGSAILMNVDGELERGKDPQLTVMPGAWKAWVAHLR